MSEWTPREQWPQWLQDANTYGAQVQVRDGTVHWHDGVWHDGVWRGGDWRIGTWRGGTWYGGTWRGGVWNGGVWNGGDWHGGDWHGGRSSVRSKYIPVWDGSRIHIGCKAGTIPEWDEWFAGDEQYETPRDTEAFRLIHAHYQAIRAWVVAMGWHGEAAQ